MKFHSVLLFFVVTSLAFSLTGCFKWAARAENKLPEETALQKTYSYNGKVIIIGAGGAGLAAAKILERNNIDYLVLEATNHYGGRLKKDTTLADFPIDLGAEWIHSNPKVLNVIKGKSGDQVDEELIPYKLDSTLKWDGKKLKSANLNSNLFYRFMPESKFKNSTWFDFFDEHIASEVKHKIVYNAAVNHIDYTGDKVKVKTESGDIYEGDKVLLAVSIGVLQANLIEFSPALSDRKKQAIASIDFLPGFKVAMKFSEKFYPDLIKCETGYGLKGGEKSYYDMAFKKESQSNILGFLCAGEEAKKYYAYNSKEDIVAALIEELDQMFAGKASKTYTGEYRLENWGQYQYTQGTWVVVPFEKSSDLTTIAEPLDNRIYFAGAILDPYKQMGAPGSMLSGYYSIDQLLTDK